MLAGLAARLRLYFNETSRARCYEEENQGLMQTMTPQLREASLAVAQELFLRVPYLSSPDIRGPSSHARPRPQQLHLLPA